MIARPKNFCPRFTERQNGLQALQCLLHSSSRSRRHHQRTEDNQSHHGPPRCAQEGEQNQNIKRCRPKHKVTGSREPVLIFYHKNRRRRVALGSERFPRLEIRRPLRIVLKCYVLLVVRGQPYDHLKCTSAPFAFWQPFAHTHSLLRIADLIVS
jgi:hypothetical protein